MSLPGQNVLEGVRVLDASRVLAGPFCGQILGDLGAEVIKIERPGQGDETRAWGPPFAGDFSAYFLSCNRNKKGVAIDLSDEEGRDLFYGLARKSDIVLENFRAESASKLGVGPDRLLEVNPKLIICSISGFGRTGPWKDLPGYDFAIQALSGLMSITGPKEGPPSKVGVAVTDVLTGLYAANAVLACLHAREKSGHGYAIDLALLDCAVAAQVNVAQAYLTTGKVPERQGNAHLQIVPYQAFQTADDWLILAIGNDRQWQRFCHAIGNMELANDSRFATNTLRVQNRQALVPGLEEIFLQNTSAEWRQILGENEIPHAPVLNYEQIFALDQVVERGMKLSITTPDGQPVDLVGSPFHINPHSKMNISPPPNVGQDTESVLQDILEMDADRIMQLRNSGVIE